MIDVLIFPGYGIGPYPKFLLDKDEEIPKFPKNRVGDIVRIIKEAAIQVDYPHTKALVEYLRSHKEAVVKSKEDDDIFYVWNESVHWLEVLQIVSVDNTKLWTIDEYDGSECIYYPEIDMVDQDLNYCEINYNKDEDSEES